MLGYKRPAYAHGLLCSWLKWSRSGDFSWQKSSIHQLRAPSTRQTFNCQSARLTTSLNAPVAHHTQQWKPTITYRSPLDSNMLDSCFRLEHSLQQATTILPAGIVTSSLM
jgi:hypothetical protein